MTTELIKGKRALLIAEGCKLNKEKKAVEARLKEIKKELEESGIDMAGTYTNEAGDSLNISETEKFTDIDPKKVLNWLRKNKLTSQFPDTVKVQITPLKKLVPESVYSKWRSPLDSVLRWSWK